jgi:hypothetical protein
MKKTVKWPAFWFWQIEITTLDLFNMAFGKKRRGSAVLLLGYALTVASAR